MTEPSPGNLYNPPADGEADALDPAARLTDSEYVAELVTSTTPAARTSPAPETPGAVTLGEAVEGWAVSERTLRRHLNAGTIPGHKVVGTHGEEWRVPVVELDARYPRLAAAVEAEVVEEERPRTDDLLALITEVLRPTQLAIEAATTQAEAATAEAIEARAAAEAARIEAARLEERLRAVEADRDRLAADLDAAQAARRRRWRSR